MAKKNSPSLDGFVPRRSVGGRENVAAESGLQPSFENSGLSHASEDREVKGSALAPQDEGGLSRTAIDESLGNINLDDGHDEQPEHKKRRHSHKIHKKKLIKRIIIVIVVLLLVGAGLLAAKVLLAGGSVFQGSVLGLVQSEPLKEDENGRSNIVVFGTSEDDEGGNHPGAYLTDSIMMISLNQTTNEAVTFSIPRDLWVQYGTTCLAGIEGRINSLYDCYSNGGQDETAGTDALRRVLQEVTGLDVQYYAHANYSVVRDVVDAVGGIDVDIQSDPVEVGGVLDRNFDWKCNYQCYYVKYDNGVHHLDGEHALALARARGDVTPTYGFARSNYSREINQQKIAIAVKEKALSVGTLTNVSKVSNLIDALGDNLRTNFDTSEIRTLMRLGEDIPTQSITRITLVDAEPALFTNDYVAGASIVRSTDGFYVYDNIIAYLNKRLSSDPAVREEAAVGIYNGTATGGLAQATADTLTERGLTVVDVGNADTFDYVTTRIYDLSGGAKSATVAALESSLNATTTQDTLPFTATGLDIVVILGASSVTDQ